MSFGTPSPNAVHALNAGAKLGGFAHNTGEGGLSPYHLAGGGDIIWQTGTGYFGCRSKSGDFDQDKFAENANRDAVKMIEIKPSQEHMAAFCQAPKSTRKSRVFVVFQSDVTSFRPRHILNSPTA